MDGGSVAPAVVLMSDFPAASRQMLDAFLPLIGLIPAEDLREELDGQLGRLRSLLDLHVAKVR